MAIMCASGYGMHTCRHFLVINTFCTMSVTLQYIVVFLIVAASVAYVVHRIRRISAARKSGRLECVGCPLKDACAKSRCENTSKPHQTNAS